MGQTSIDKLVLFIYLLEIITNAKIRVKEQAPSWHNQYDSVFV